MSTCYHCNHDVAYSAEVCPKCGARDPTYEYYTPPNPTESAWDSLVVGPFFVCLFGIVAYVLIRIGVPIVVIVIGFFSSAKVNGEAVNEFTSWAAIVGAIGAMFWLVQNALGGMRGIRAYFAGVPENAALLVRRLAQLLFAAGVVGGVLYLLYQVVKSAFFK